MKLLFNAFAALVVLVLLLVDPIASEEQESDSLSLGRDLADLGARWDITEPTLDNVGSQLVLGWKVSDYIQDSFATFNVYDGFECEEGSNDITDKISDIQNGDAYFQTLGLRPDSTTPYEADPNTSGDGVRDMRLFLSIQANGITKAPIYSETTTNNGEVKVTIAFCVRFSLYNEDPDETGAIEINFRETLITLFVDLTDGFQVGEIVAQDKLKGQETASIACEVIGYECDLQNQPLDNPGFLRDQGSEVRVCVSLSDESKRDGLVLDRIVTFYFVRDNGPDGLVTQDAIISDSKAEPDGLTDYNCMRGVEVCSFDTILKADFFDREGVGIVRGIGEAFCMFDTSPTLTEDVQKQIGRNVIWYLHDYSTDLVNAIEISGFPIGTQVAYTHVDQSLTDEIVESEDFLVFFEGSEADIRSALNTLTITPVPQSDDEFQLPFTVATDTGRLGEYSTRVNVLAVADLPSVSAAPETMTIDEDTPGTIVIVAGRSIDDDNSETLSVVITVPSDENGPVGTITAPSAQDVQLTLIGAGKYEVVATGPNTAAREASLNALLVNGVTFTPRANWASVLTGDLGIQVEAVSTERGESAPNDSEVWGTLGDLNTQIESAFVYVNVYISPVDDLPVLNGELTIVQENNLQTNVDDDLIIDIGTILGMTVADMDGSQSLSLTLTGFPTNAQDLRFTIPSWNMPDNVIATIDKTTGIVVISGDNVVDVLPVVASLQLILADDDDSNIVIDIQGTSTDTNGVDVVSDDFTLSHTIIVQAVADTPNIIVGENVKPDVAENSTELTSYPVTVLLTDTDGSETFLDKSVTVEFSTSPDIAAGTAPEVDFTYTNGVTFLNSNGIITLTGNDADIEAALESMMIRPGNANGEDITVTVRATAVELNTTEANSGGAGNVGDEIAIATSLGTNSFVIPVDPVIQGTPILTLSETSVTGNEDTQISLGYIVVDLDGILDPDGSEIYYLEVEVSSFRTGTKFYVDGALQSGTVLSGWLRLPNSAASTISIVPPLHYSGLMILSLRGHIVDSSTTGIANAMTPAQTIDVTVLPIADSIRKPTSLSGVEDAGPVAFGATLANGNSGIRVRDTGTGNQNNPDSETISRVQLVIPGDVAGTLTYQLSGTYVPSASGLASGSGTGQVEYDPESRTYIITSSIVTNAGDDVTTLTQAQREQAEQDIRDTLASFQVEIGPSNTDSNGVIAVTATSLDVNYDIGASSSKDNPFNLAIIVKAVADTPNVFTRDALTVFEDGGNVPLDITVGHSVDSDGSETLSVRFVVPKESNVPIGSIVGTTPNQVTLTDAGDGIFLVEATGASSQIREAALNSYLSGGGVEFDPRDNWAGCRTGTDGLRVDVISIEGATGGELADAAYGGADGTAATEVVSEYIDICVLPVADLPTVYIKSKGGAIGKEDTMIAVPVGVTLGDSDGSESFEMLINGSINAAGTRLFGANGVELFQADGFYTLQSADVDALQILPPLDWSSALPSQGDIILSTTTVVTDTSQSGGAIDVLPYELDIPVAVTGVSDKPNSRTVTVNAVEDEEYDVGSAIGDLTGILVDVDGSETLSLVIGGLPAGMVLSTIQGDGITYIGSGEWQIEGDAAIASLKLSPRLHYSGKTPYSGVTFRAISQELDGDESRSDYWVVTFDVTPVADGFNNWSPSFTVTERQNEDLDFGVSLSSVSAHTFIDDDGSETVVNYQFDLSTLLDSAGIEVRLQVLMGSGSANLDDLAANYIAGDFTYDPNTGKITVLAGETEGLVLKSELFLDSNQNFNISVTALIRDTATIDGVAVTDEIIESEAFSVNLIGTADVPTIFASSGEGDNDAKTPVSFGGDTTDTDVSLGREQSEYIYYLASAVELGYIPSYAFVDSNNKLIGFPSGSGTWLMTPKNIQEADGGVFFSTFPTLNIDSAQVRRAQETASSSPSSRPSTRPSSSPTTSPSTVPSTVPSKAPSKAPTTAPSKAPTTAPSTIPSTSAVPSTAPSKAPTTSPSTVPSTSPSKAPTPAPSPAPSTAPSTVPSTIPSTAPSTFPSRIPSAAPSATPSTAPSFSPSTAHFNFTVVAVESDGDIETSVTEDLYVDVAWLGFEPEPFMIPPLAPICDIGVNIGLEDVDLTVNVTAMAQETDPTNPAVSVVISNLHPDANVTGAYLNIVTRSWVATAAAVTAGNVKITPPVDWSGSMELKVECIASTWYSLLAATGELDAALYFDPVADGVKITVPTLDGIEDQPIALDITLELIDTDGSEQISSNGYVLVGSGATLEGSYELVVSSADDALIDGISLVGYYRVPTGDFSSLVLQPDENWSGVFTVRAAAYSTEIFDDEDNDHLKLTLSESVNMTAEAVANPPVITVPDLTVGLEDADIIIQGLSAAMASVTATEMLSVVISGVPEGSMFSAGSNSGDQRWSIPVASLANIAIRPPAHYAGTMTLTFTAIAMEPSNGSEAQTSQDFIVGITPIADDVIIVAKNIVLISSGVANMDLNVQMHDTRGITGGEIGPEIITLTFSNVQTGVFFHANLGGKTAEIGSGVWAFTGTQEQANALQVASGSNLSQTTQTITVSGMTIDGDSFLDPPVLDDFILTVAQPTSMGLEITATSGSDTSLVGAAGNDDLTGGNGNDIISGGAGMDRLSGLGGDNTLTGGSGADQFIISPGSMDTITDFDASEGDQVDVSSLLETYFNLQQDDASDFIQLAVNGPNTAIKVSATGSGSNYITVVLLQGVTGLTLEDMMANGNLIVAHIVTEVSQVPGRYLKNDARDLAVYEFAECAEVPVVLWESDSLNRFPEGTVTIDEQTGTTVTFTVTPKWQSGPQQTTSNWNTALYPVAPMGDNACPMREASAEPVTYTANCNNGMTSAFLFVDLFHDSSTMGLKMDSFVPDDCKAPDGSDGKKVGYEILIPCMPCQEIRNLEQVKAKKQKKVAASAANINTTKTPAKRTLQVSNQVAPAQTQFEMLFETEEIEDKKSSAMARKGYFAIVLAAFVGASVALF